DIVYMRNNIHKNQVYNFPVNIAPYHQKTLFLQYLKKADELPTEPKWRNTRTSNCTSLIFDLVQAINTYPLPEVYRLFASVYL
ncbi:lipoprotein N-acyltransferase Lnb domain-containing protein, partial [Acinetobacter baumannii]